MFASSFFLGKKKVGPGNPALVIAEAGVAHFGDPEKADILVDMAVSSGADVFKTQAFITEQLVSGNSPEWRERLKPKEVDYPFLRRMKDRCDRHDLLFMCTAHDEQSLKWVNDLDAPCYKIGSGERGNIPFLSKIAARGKPILLSTGMHRKDDISLVLKTVSAAGCRELALLHCVTCYPTPYKDVNLMAMDSLRAMFPGPVGYSDHTEGCDAALAAVARGSQIIEKHITLDFNVHNAQDWKVSVGQDDLVKLVRRIRDIEAMMGDGVLDVMPCEQPALIWALKSLVACRDLAAGTVLTSDMILAKRPGIGLAPTELKNVIGRRLRESVAADQPITQDSLI